MNQERQLGRVRALKAFLLVLCGVLLAVLFCSCDMLADNAVYAVVSENNLSSDGFYYTLYENNTAVITGMKDKGSQKALIPGEIDSSYKVIAIAENAFESCENLKYVSIGDGVQRIEQGAFRKCYGLLCVDLSPSVTSIGAYAFDSCEKLCEVNYTEGLRSIGDCAFYKCISLSVIEFGDKLETIGAECFFNCYSLTKAILPSSLKSAGEGAFAYCSSITRAELGGLTEIPDSFMEKAEALLSIDIPSRITRIGERAFKTSRNLETLTIGKKVTYIGDAAFEGTLWLAKQTDDFCIVGDGILLKYGGKDANVVIPDNVKVIADAFEGCERLQTVTIGSKVKKIAKYAFNGCVNLTDVVITAKVTEIENCAFLGCIALKTVELPKTLTSIGDNAFGNCSSLMTVIYKGTSVEWGKVTVGQRGNNSLYSAKIVYEG